MIFAAFGLLLIENFASETHFSPPKSSQADSANFFRSGNLLGVREGGGVKYQEVWSMLQIRRRAERWKYWINVFCSSRKFMVKTSLSSPFCCCQASFPWKLRKIPKLRNIFKAWAKTNKFEVHFQLLNQQWLDLNVFLRS